ncbi:DUF3306 domain-containing protein [Photobacterium sp. MCCC 1A19761]|uniref:DUF3306 domain-containing protein n=1 Tax=Photobacterium sp. MCCC 1A19761 TaxID=3115000 RepID=UPI00307D43E5
MATSFLQRWSQRKRAAEHSEPDEHRTNKAVSDGVSKPSQEVSSANIADISLDKTGADGDESAAPVLPTMNEVAAVSYERGVAAFMQAGVEKAVKKAALLKLFHFDEYNYISDMEDHTEDFAGVASLDRQVTQTLRRWVNQAVEQPTSASSAAEQWQLDVEKKANVDTSAGVADASLVSSQVNETESQDADASQEGIVALETSGASKTEEG